MRLDGLARVTGLVLMVSLTITMESVTCTNCPATLEGDTKEVAETKLQEHMTKEHSDNASEPAGTPEGEKTGEQPAAGEGTEQPSV